MFKKITEKLINGIFYLQNKFLSAKYNKKAGKTHFASSEFSKNKMISGADLSLSSELNKIKEKVLFEVNELAKENSNNLFELLNFAKNEGVNFYIIKNADKLLKPVKEKTGLIFEKRGFGAIYLNLITLKKISLKTPVMFVFDNNLNGYNILYNFYKWYSYKMKLPGFDEKTLSSFNTVYEGRENFDNLNYEEVINLKHAIQRDKEAAEFALKFMKEREAGRKVYDILKNNTKGAGI